MKRYFFILLSLLCVSTSASAAEGIIMIPSNFSVAETAGRLETVLAEKGMTIFNRIDHAAAADKVDVPLRGTVLFIFGNPKVGSPLMQCQQSVAIDLPQKILIWEDENQRVWLSYNDPAHLVARHRIAGCGEVITKVTKALDVIGTAAASE